MMSTVNGNGASSDIAAFCDEEIIEYLVSYDATHDHHLAHKTQNRAISCTAGSESAIRRGPVCSGRQTLVQLLDSRGRKGQSTTPQEISLFFGSPTMASSSHLGGRRSGQG